MAYQLSAAKLQAYHRCPQAYYFRYERGLKNPAVFGSSALGNALHQALAKIYGNWHYRDPIPSLDWIEFCWQDIEIQLSENLVAEGQKILHRYYEQYILSPGVMHKPLAVERRIKGTLQIEQLEFSITGRYDRLDWLEDGLELIDYKSTKEVHSPDSTEFNLQMGLYYLVLEQIYQQSLKQVSLLFLRTGEKFSFEVTPEHKQEVTNTISDLALRLRTENQWEPLPGEQCSRCSYARYCSGVCEHPEALPETAKPEQGLQLVLGL